MQRVTIVLDEELMEELDHLIAQRGYQNRSEAIRDLTRSGIRQANEKANPTRNCVAALVYVFDHGTRELPKRLIRFFHEHQDICMYMSVTPGRS